jgi:hypothetical protein
VAVLLARAPLEDGGLAVRAILAVSMVLGFTRSIFLLGFPVGLLYLLWFWKKWLVAAVPAVVFVVFFLGPHALRERIASVFEPHGEVDSNRHRRFYAKPAS